MTTVVRTFNVHAAAPTVLDYLKDFGNTVHWDPATESCTRDDDGVIGPGSSWRNVSKVLGATNELIYTLEEVGDDLLVFVGRGEHSTSTDTITVRPLSPMGSEVTYQVELELAGLAKLIDPAMKLAFENLANETQQRLTDALNMLAGRSST